MAQQIPKALEDDIKEYNATMAQMQIVMFQKQQFKYQLDDVESALKELDKAKGPVFRNVGVLLLQSSKDEASESLKERKEALSVRLSSLAKQEEKLRERMDDLKTTIEKSAGAAGISLGGAG